MITEFIVTAGEARKRLDQYLLGRARDMSRSGLQRLIALGRFRLNAQVVKPGHKIKPGDRITLDSPQPGPLLMHDESVPLEILHEDETLLIVNKPPGVVVHPGSGNWTGTILNAALAHLQNRNSSHDTGTHLEKPGIVHRLDKDTSGIMVIAKTVPAHRALAEQFERHTVTRTYEALTWSAPGLQDGVIDLAIGRDRRNPQRVSGHSEYPKCAITTYKVIQRFGEAAAHVRLSPQTGRTHQLRVHMASIGCPILGDRTYGGQKVLAANGIEISRVMLHARLLGFRHPSSGHYQEHTVEIPPDMQAILQALSA